MNSFYLFINIPPKKILYQMKYLFFRSREGTALFLLFCFVFTGVRLVYNLVLVSAVQSESAVCVYRYNSEHIQTHHCKSTDSWSLFFLLIFFTEKPSNRMT